MTLGELIHMLKDADQSAVLAEGFDHSYVNPFTMVQLDKPLASGGKPLPICALCDEPITDTPVPVHEYGDAVGHAECVANAGEAADVAKHG